MTDEDFIFGLSVYKTENGERHATFHAPAELKLILVAEFLADLAAKLRKDALEQDARGQGWEVVNG